MKSYLQVAACALLLLAMPKANAGLGPRTISTQEFDPGTSLVFQVDADKVAAAFKDAVADRKWKMLYEGSEPPKKGHSYFSNASGNPFSFRTGDKAAWEKAKAEGLEPKAYLQAKTPTSAFSFGAELFVVVYQAKDSGSFVSIAASTSQIKEKKKLESYISDIAKSLNEKLGNASATAAP